MSRNTKRAKMMVLDGQQRLQSLFIGFERQLQKGRSSTST